MGLYTVTYCFSIGIYSHYVPSILYNKDIQNEIHSQIMQFIYIDIEDYPVTREGIYQACYDEVVAEATDTGDLPMYGQQMLNFSAELKFKDFMADIERMVGVK